MATQTFPTPVSTLGFRDTIEIDGNNCTPDLTVNPTGTCADITHFADTATLPEPSAIVLGLIPAGGEVLLGWLRRRCLHPR